MHHPGNNQKEGVISYQKVKLLLAPRAAAPFKKLLVGCKLFSLLVQKTGKFRLKTHTVHTAKGFVKHFGGHKLLPVVGLRHV